MTTRARIEKHGGVPRLVINGQVHPGMAYAAYTPTSEVYADFAAAGVDLYTFSATPTEAGYGLSRTAWTAPGIYDFSQLDERVALVLSERPDAWIFPRLYLHAPPWWSAAHPDDIVLMDPGDGNPVPFVHAGGKPAPSWASETWRADTITGLGHVIDHVQNAPYADHVIGYHLSSGTTEEWMMWGGNEDQWVDYSPVNLKRYRAWLRARYGSNAALQAAWHDPEITFDDARIPTRAERARTECESLRDPESERWIVDFYLYNSHLVADTICALAAATRRMAGPDRLVGVFYGYLLQLCGEQRQQNAGHNALEQVLASPDIDFMTSPSSYAFREVGGEGTSHYMALLDSVQRHGKLWFNENDIRTSLTDVPLGQWGRPATVAEDLLQQDKELANALVNGAAQWWFDVGHIRYDDPVLMQRIQDLAAHAGEIVSRDRSPVAQVSLVVDEDSLSYLRVGDAMGRDLLVGQLPALHRIGAPVAHDLVSDLPSLRSRRLLILPTSVAPSPRDAIALNDLKSQKRVLLFLWASGLYCNGRLDPEATAAWCGLHLAHEPGPADLTVTIQGDHPLMRELEGLSYGGVQAGPLVWANDPQAEILGTLPDGRPGLALRRHEGWTAVHSAAPLLPAALLARIAELAGVHRYITTEDVLWARRDLVGIVAHQAGARTISLPRPATVWDLYSGKPVAASVRTFEAGFTENQTRVFILE